MQVLDQFLIRSKKAAAVIAFMGVIAVATPFSALAQTTYHRRHHSHHTGAKIIGGSAVGGAVVGGLVGGPKGALIGAGVGAGAGAGANEIRKHRARHHHHRVE
ncbi:MAG TPA: hypothetical protein VGD64_16000 [Acidisarcina sp.]